MLRSERPARTPISRSAWRSLRENQVTERSWRVDWRGWLALAWALWFGWQYARMVVEVRGAKLESVMARRVTGGQAKATQH